ETLTAYLPTNAPDPEAQRALEMIIDQTSTASAPATVPLPVLDPRPVVASTGVATAALGTPAPAPAAGLFQQTFGATETAAPDALAQALAAHVAKASPDSIRQRDLVAPDLEHVADIFTAPNALASDHFAVIFD